MTEFSDAWLGEPSAAGESVAGALPYPHPDPNPPSDYPLPPPSSHPGNGLGIASLVVGIVAVVAIISAFGGVFFGIVAAVLGLIARRRVKRGEATNAGTAAAGVTLGIVAVVFSSLLLWLMFGTELFNENYQHCLGEQNGHEEYCQQYR